MELHVQPGAPPHAMPGSEAAPAQHHRRGLRGRKLCQATGRAQAGCRQPEEQGGVQEAQGGVQEAHGGQH